jgi:hypothetical protein
VPRTASGPHPPALQKFILKDDAEDKNVAVTKLCFPNSPILMLPGGLITLVYNLKSACIQLILNNLERVRKTGNYAPVTYTYIMS